MEGLLWGAIAWTGGLRHSRRRVWVASAVAATLALTVVGVLRTTGVIGKLIIG